MIKELTVSISIGGDHENSPEDALHHALARLSAAGVIQAWTDPIDEEITRLRAALSEAEKDRDNWKDRAIPHAVMHSRMKTAEAELAQVRNALEGALHALDLLYDSAGRPAAEGSVIGIARAALSAKDTYEAHERGIEAAIRKGGQVAIDHLIDTGLSCEATNDDLADYLTRIVDACVSAALSAKEGK